MAGLYLHIPFCRQACHYCNFHFSTSLKYRSEMVEALLTELELRCDYLPEPVLDTVYFGGGTPSLLSAAELERIFARITALFELRPGAEVTLEANPDDLTDEKVWELRATPVNRFSIGVQSFFEEDLRLMNRAHNAREARAGIEKVQTAGFDNLTIDLIYGAPSTTDARWEENLRIAIGYGVPHLSSYCLTVEERTALHHFVKTGQVPPVDEEQAARQFEILVAAMRAADYEHYEISNFARPGRQARHNSSYWQGEPYLGIGPSAHSFNGESRQWNVANNAKYIRALQSLRAQPADRRDWAALRELEHLTPAQQYNEYVMTGLRTSRGVDLDRIRGFGYAFATGFQESIQPFLAAGQVERLGVTFRLTDQGKLLADGIAAAVFQ